MEFYVNIQLVLSLVFTSIMATTGKSHMVATELVNFSEAMVIHTKQIN